MALNLYLKLPFGKLHSKTREIKDLAMLIDRTPGSVAMRLNNFANVDPFHQKRGIKGLSGGIRQVQPIWEEFSKRKEDLIFESEKALAKRANTTIEMKFPSLVKDLDGLKGEMREQIIKIRVNQNHFRDVVLNNYSEKCAITGISIPELLIASHIIPWSKNKQERLNPQNGICLAALHDKAFEKGFIGITTDFRVLISPSLKKFRKETYYKPYFEFYENKRINLPKRFLPNRMFLEYHLAEIFRKS